MEVNYTVTNVSQLDENCLITKVNYVIGDFEINNIEVMHYNPTSHEQIKQSIISRGLTEQAKQVIKTVMDEAIANPSLISQ